MTITITDLESARHAVEQVQRGWASHTTWVEEETATFSANKRERLYAQLASAYSVGLRLIEATAEPLFLQLYKDAFKKEPDNRPGVNPWAARVQLLFGHWELDDEGKRKFVPDRSAWKYSKSFRNFADSNLTPSEALQRLVAGKITLQKAERDDAARHAAGDPDEVVKMARFREFVRYMPRRAKVPNSLPGSDPKAPRAAGQLGAFWGIYTNDHNFEIIGQLPINEKVIFNHAVKQASDHKDEVEERKANEAKRDEFHDEWFSRDESNAVAAYTALTDAGLPEEAEAALAKNPTVGFADSHERRRSREEMLADAATEHAKQVVYPEPEAPAEEKTKTASSKQKTKHGKRGKKRRAGYNVAKLGRSANSEGSETTTEHSAPA
jgi:hypothetical protein